MTFYTPPSIQQTIYTQAAIILAVSYGVNKILYINSLKLNNKRYLEELIKTETVSSK